MTWSFGGTALSTYGQVTLIDDSLDMPDRRGENQIIPYQHGRRFVEKYFDERKMAFGIAIKKSSAAALEASLDSLRANIGMMIQQTLSHTMESGDVRTALASVDKSIDINRGDNPLFARAVIEFTLAFPFFRLSTVVTSNETTINANPKAMTVANPGTVEERNPQIILTGPLSNTVITNSTNGCILRYTGTIASPRIVTIQIIDGQFVATDDLGANKIANVSHEGAACWMVLNTPTNSLSVADDTHTTGKVKLNFYAPYF